MKILSIWKKEISKQNKDIAKAIVSPVYIRPVHKSEKRAKEFFAGLSKGCRTLPGTPIPTIRLPWPATTEKWLIKPTQS